MMREGHPERFGTLGLISYIALSACTFEPSDAPAAVDSGIGAMDADLQPRADSGLIDASQPDVGFKTGPVDAGVVPLDAGASLYLRVETTTVTERQTAEVIARLQAPNDGDPIALTWSTHSGTATEGIDYIPISRATAVIPTGSTTVALAFDTREDLAREDTETVFVQIDDAPETIVVDVATATVAILDDSTPTIRGLEARYYLDEGIGGGVPIEVTDALGRLNLNVDIVGDEPAFDGAPTAAGARWTTQTTTARIGRAIAGTRFRNQLNGSTHVTFEAVMTVDSVGPERSFVMVVGRSGVGSLSMTLEPDGGACLNYGTGGSTCWPLVGLADQQRHTVAMIYNTADVLDRRALLYIDGSLAGVSGGVFGAPAENRGLNVTNNEELVIGNSNEGGQATLGRISYVSVYNVALDSDEILRNAQLIDTNGDDTP